MTMRRTALLALCAVLAACDKPQVPLYDNLGSLHHAIGGSRRAQAYFDQGLRLSYAFNHAEAVRAFREGARLDPGCAMCWWGVAYASGPNINAPMDSAGGATAWTALQEALRAKGGASEAEQAYIDALARRYGANPTADRAARDSAYAAAMTALAARYPDDLDASTMAAEAAMILRPWNYYAADGTAHPGVAELVGVLERVVARDSLHPGACHLYIHAVEASPEPARALPCARHLEGAMPGAGHLVHMPGHVYLRLGMYADAERVNVHAAHSDEAFIAGQSEPGFYSMAYYPHNLHFLWAAAAFDGRSAAADSAIRRLLAVVTPEQVAAVPYLETFRLAWYYHLDWLEQWDAALADSAPPAAWTTSTGLWHYVRGRALAARGSLPEARVELDRLRANQREASRLPPAVVVGFAPPATLLDIASDVLAGDIAARAGRTAEAVRLLESAVAKEDALTYNEPADWYPPTRLTLGRVLTDAGRGGDAQAVYREELRRRPHGRTAERGLARAEGRPTD
jgi:tetratricopeptide (TPR) repeat protein